MSASALALCFFFSIQSWSRVTLVTPVWIRSGYCLKVINNCGEFLLVLVFRDGKVDFKGWLFGLTFESAEKKTKTIEWTVCKKQSEVIYSFVLWWMFGLFSSIDFCFSPTHTDWYFSCVCCHEGPLKMGEDTVLMLK